MNFSFPKRHQIITLHYILLLFIIIIIIIIIKYYTTVTEAFIEKSHKGKTK